MATATKQVSGVLRTASAAVQRVLAPAGDPSCLAPTHPGAVESFEWREQGADSSAERSAPRSGGAKRRYEPTTVAWSGSLELRDRRVDCVVTKVSAAGATVQVYEPVVCLISIVLHCPRLDPCRARIIWRRDNLLGLRFLEKPQKIALALSQAASKRPLVDHSAEPARSRDHADLDEDGPVDHLDEAVPGADALAAPCRAILLDPGRVLAGASVSDDGSVIEDDVPDDTNPSAEGDDGDNARSMEVDELPALLEQTHDTSGPRSFTVAPDPNDNRITGTTAESIVEPATIFELPLAHDGASQDRSATLYEPRPAIADRTTLAEDRRRTEQPVGDTHKLWPADTDRRFIGALAEVRRQAEAALQAAEHRRIGETTALSDALSRQEEGNATLARAASEWQAAEAGRRLAEAEHRWQLAEAERLEAARLQWEAEKREIRAEAERERAASEQRMAAAVARWRQEEVQRFATAAHDWQAKAEEFEGTVAALKTESEAREQEFRHRIDEMRGEAERHLRLAQAEWQSETARRLAEAKNAIRAVFEEQLATLDDDQQARLKTQ